MTKGPKLIDASHSNYGVLGEEPFEESSFDGYFERKSSDDKFCNSSYYDCGDSSENESANSPPVTNHRGKLERFHEEVFKTNDYHRPTILELRSRISIHGFVYLCFIWIGVFCIYLDEIWTTRKTMVQHSMMMVLLKCQLLHQRYQF